MIMGVHFSFLLLVLGVSFLGNSTSDTISSSIGDDYEIKSLNRSSFPADFIFGTTSAAYQYEGAASEDGREPSIWDTYTHNHPERIMDGSNGDVADDSYHKYKEDVRIMKQMGFDAYRFSISWSRILPKGTLSGGVNKKGGRYYHNLIKELLANDITPFVTLFHWDVPQALEDEYGGFRDSRIVDDFRDFADLCFKEYGDKVKHWITLNEPWTFTKGGYAEGTFAPGRCSASKELSCTGGDSATEPYLVAHHLLLAHAAAVDVYRQRYQEVQKGIIGITLITHWMIPLTEESDNVKAASNALDFMFGWFMDPIANGYYPDSMRTLVGDRLPEFKKEQSQMLKGSYDFLGLNYYSARYAVYEEFKDVPPSYTTDSRANLTFFKDGVALGEPSASAWLRIYPRGLYDLLVHTKKKYNNPLIYITENGIDEVTNPHLSLEEALKDPMRIQFHHDHLSLLQRAVSDGVDVKGYFAWSLLDNFEWANGYTVRFGIYYVDFKDGQRRHPKLSAYWFRKFLELH